MRLDYRARLFINSYVVDEDVERAAGLAGISVSQGYKILAGPDGAEYAQQRKLILLHKAGVTPEFVVAEWYKIATADVNELVSVIRVNCRHCWGVDHRYQWTVVEYEAACDTAIRQRKNCPDGIGGFDFMPTRQPNPDCPECGGIGAVDVLLADTRHLSDAGKVLYDGAEQTKYGVKIKLRDRDAALNNLARYMGMLVDRKELAIESTKTLEELSDEQLAAIVKQSSGN